MTKLAVLIPVFNAERYLLQTLQSLSDQDDSDFRAIIIDNGSEDRSYQIAEDFAKRDKRFILIKEENRGIDRALNRGLAELKEEKFVTFLDSDDIYLRERNKKLIEFMEAGRLDIAACNAFFIDEQGYRIGRNIDYTGFGKQNLAEVFFAANVVPTLSQIMLRREFILQLGKFLDAFRWTLDYFLFVSALIMGKNTSLFNEFLVEKRYHQKNFGTDPLNVTPARLRLAHQLYEKLLKNCKSPESAAKIYNARYIRDVQTLRRTGKETAITGFLQELCKEKIISRYYYDYFNLVVLSRLNILQAEEYCQTISFNHPLQFFAAGFFYYRKGDLNKAAKYFEMSREKSGEFFPEALHALAVSVAAEAPDYSLSLINRCLNEMPNFYDALRSKQLIADKRFSDLKLNGYITEKTLDYFLNYYEKI